MPDIIIQRRRSLLSSGGNEMSNEVRSEASNTATLAIYWLIVGLPLLWGVTQTLNNAMQLFQ